MHAIRRYLDIINETLDAETHRVIVFHGGRDFDQVDKKHFGSGEPGNIRPLGKGLYCGLAVTPDDFPSAIELAKVYAVKYGRNTPTIHGFEALLPSKIKNLGYENPGWARTGGNDDRTSWEAEALPWRHSAEAPRAKEIAIMDVTLIRRIGKWPVATPTQQIVNDLT